MTWIAALMSVAAVALQILALCFGEAAQIRTVNIWFQKVLPIAALLLFVMQILIWGDKSLYRTTTPVFWVCVYLARSRLICTCTAAMRCSDICAMWSFAGSCIWAII